MYKLATYTLGCRVNQFETLSIEDSARLNNFEICDWNSTQADVGIVNSCALTLLAEAKTRQAIRIFARNNPTANIAVTGCYAQTDTAAIEELPNVKWIIGNKAKQDIISIIKKNPARPYAQTFFEATADADACLSSEGKLEDRTNLKIQDGCDNACAYCIIPRARGIPHSRDFDRIISDAQRLVERGVREIIITGINISKFESPKGTLVDIIDALNSIPNLLRIRIGSIEPPNFHLDALLERMSDTSHALMPHLHISAQSLCDKVLQAMRRRYLAKDFLEIVEKSKSKVPNIGIGADLICGHPYEGENEFETTKKNFEISGLTYAHIFTFSPRPKTLAATMSQFTPPKPVRKARADEMREISKTVQSAFLTSQLGTTQELLLENRLSSGEYLAYTPNYLPAIISLKSDGLKNTIVKGQAHQIKSSRIFFI